MAARHEPIALTLVVALLAALQACKKQEPSRTPTELDDDIAQIDAALHQREAELQRAGIVVAYRAPVRSEPAGAAPEIPATEPAEDVADEEVPTGVEPRPEPPTTTEVAPVESSPTQEREAMDAPRSAPPDRKRRAHAHASNRSRLAAERDQRRPHTRCEKICVLADTTCELRERVCTLAGEHPDDVRYQDACRRAEDQCGAATQHCESCAV
jgi:hypothetical protein